MIARVIVDIKHQSVNQTFDYLVHEKDQLHIQKGMRVIVPFTDNNILRLGFVYDIISASDLAHKYVHEILDIEPIFNDELFLMMDKLIEDPNALIAEAFETVIPKQLLIHYEKKATLLEPKQLPDDLVPFFKQGVWTLLKKDEVYYNRLKTLEQKGIVELKTVLKTRNKKPLITYVRIDNRNYHGTPKQHEVLDILSAHSQMKKADLVANSSASIVNTLIKKAVIEVFYESDKLEVANFNKTTELPVINEDLKDQIKDMMEAKHQVYVSQYQDTKLDPFFFHLIHEVISQGKQVLIMVPENFMIDSVKSSLEKVFREELIIGLNRGQTDKQMMLKYSAILDNETKIVVGARSSVFTSFSDLGLIIITDSNNHSYRAHEGIYYQALEIAEIRTRYHGIPLYLSASSISLDNYVKIQQKTHELLNLQEEVYKSIELIDMKEELKKGNTKLVSLSLNDAILNTLDQNKKVLLILNQKGYAPFVMCRTCSHVPVDPETGIPLRFDEKQNILKSNLTKYQLEFTKTCPVCGKHTVKSVGSGIDQLITYLHKAYPSKEILKVDSEAISNKTYHDKIEDLSQIDIIVGTQMALKSNLEDKIDLVGILMIDQWLKLPKFDAYEATYELLSQAKFITKDKLIIQSYDPTHFVLKSIIGDGSTYYKEELSRRRISKLPPYYQVLQLRIEGMSYLKTFQYALSLKTSLEKMGLTVLGPTSSVLLKHLENYRVLLTIKYQGSLKAFNHLLKSNKDIKIYMNHDVSWY